MTKNRWHKGFTAIELIVVAVIIGVLGLGGWLVWNNLRKNDTKNSTQQPSEQSQSAATNDPTEGGKYLVIEEWGVRFPLPEELRGDVYYEYDVIASNIEPSVRVETIKLRSRELDTAAARCNGTIFYIYNGISRSKKKLTGNEHPYPGGAVAFKRLGDYWYDDYTTAQASFFNCADPNYVAAQKDKILLKVGGAQKIYEHIQKIELVPQAD